MFALPIAFHFIRFWYKLCCGLYRGTSGSRKIREAGAVHIVVPAIIAGPIVRYSTLAMKSATVKKTFVISRTALSVL
jgi:hypothetical protein